MIDLKALKSNIDNGNYFILALNYYNKLIRNNPELSQELPESINLNDIEVKNKSVSILLEHPFIPTPSIEVCLDLFAKSSSRILGSYHLITDNKQAFVDVFLLFK